MLIGFWRVWFAASAGFDGACFFVAAHFMEERRVVSVGGHGVGVVGPEYFFADGEGALIERFGVARSGLGCNRAPPGC